ncbi:MAG: 1-deoxy-D-xylulose-5-phosphate synthase [Thermoguttaceae bacterium]|jgi:1-deoxy-D-xylulose-5-phosphate synthase|nr:1-deoxy-D-xylulose-5-phosphate synthase [Thermoguttaceae bacterium]
MDKLLSRINSPKDLQNLRVKELCALAEEMREALHRLAATRTAHFASNLGVIELTLALHTTFDFSHDRLIWDTGHQVYAHKMVTGRYDEFITMRAKGGLMGYPNPAESEYDLLMTGHAGCSVSTALGLKCGDELARPDEKRHVVAVVGDGAFPCGVVYEAMNHAGGLKKNLTVVLNDNKMSICQRVGSLADTLDRLRMAPFYTGLKAEIQRILSRVPVLGDPVERFILQFKDAVKAGLLGGMLFEDLGFRYIGPVDGHNIAQLQKYLAMTKKFDGPVLLHVVTEKGHGFEPAERDPTRYHAPAPFSRENGKVVAAKLPGAPPYTQVARDAIGDAMRRDRRALVITAAMCQGNMLEPIRDEFPDRFFDVGICESHAVSFAAGLAKTGLRPIVDVYSTFLQRSYDQIFQEMSLQNLPVLLMLDRAGLVGPDGPTHHGVFDLCYLRPFPNLVVMAPGDARDLRAMVDWALSHDMPAAIRYAKATARQIDRKEAPIELGRAEVLRQGNDGTIVACGCVLPDCLTAAGQLAAEGVELTVINARFVKPLDTAVILDAVEKAPFVLTVEEGQLMGGFGSAVLEAAADAGLETARLRRLGIPDRYIEHATRSELLADLRLDADGITAACRELAAGTVHGGLPRFAQQSVGEVQ